jgi:RecA-family ATPase
MLARDQGRAAFAKAGFPSQEAQQEPPMPEGPEDYGLPPIATESDEATSTPQRRQPLRWLDMSNWDREPVPQRKWAIRDRVPLNQAGLFSGEGGTGKSIIELMKNVAHVAGKDWLGSMPEHGPAIYLGAEDDKDEIHIRLAAIAKHYDVSFKQLIDNGLHVLPLLGQDATLCAASAKSGRVEVTSLYRQLYEAAGDIKPINISIDTLSRAFAGNEIDRVQVYAFAMHMQALAMVAGGSVTVLSHPSLAGIASGSGISGSTAWHGAFRFRQYLKGVKVDSGEQPENDLRELEFKKNQYGPIGEAAVLRYQGGLFLPEAGAGSLDKLAREAKAEEMFLDLLRRFAAQGRNVGDKPTSPNYGPAAFAKEADARTHNIRKPDLDAAMRRLFDTNKIHVESYGRPSRPATRLSVKP